MAEQKSSPARTAPLGGAASVLHRVPGADMVTRAATETLDKVCAVSPRGRRAAVYVGAGVLGAAGVVEWPVALTGAAVAWLTQPRPAPPADAGQGPQALSGGLGLAATDDQGAGEPPGPVAVGERAAAERLNVRRADGPEPEPPHDLGTAALRSDAAGRAAAPTAAEDQGGDTGTSPSGGGGAAVAGVPSGGVRTEDAEAFGGAGTETAGASFGGAGMQGAKGAETSGGAGAEGAAGAVAAGGAGVVGEAEPEAGGGGAAEASDGGRVSGGARRSGGSGVSGGAEASRGTRASGSSRATRGAKDSVLKRSGGPLGPTARPDRTTL